MHAGDHGKHQEQLKIFRDLPQVTNNFAHQGSPLNRERKDRHDFHRFGEFSVILLGRMSGRGVASCCLLFARKSCSSLVPLQNIYNLNQENHTIWLCGSATLWQRVASWIFQRLNLPSDHGGISSRTMLCTQIS